MPQNDALVQPQLELDQINYFIPEPDMEDYMYTTAGPTSNKTTSHGVVVRGEEIGIVLMVLILWVGAIILFFNRWGKIRMLEPYQPKFCEHHNPNCPMADVVVAPVTTTYTRTFSKFNLSDTGPIPHFSKCNYHGVTSATATTCTTEPLLNNGSGGGPSGARSMSISMGGLGMPPNFNFQGPRLGGSRSPAQNRLRQNSVFVPSPTNLPASFFGESTQLGKNTGGRKTKSAVDLSTIVLNSEIMDTVRRNSKNSITNL